MNKNLVIVESPAKARTIQGYLGKDFLVVSCMGHVRDLPKGNNVIDINNNFEPTYEITPDKKEIIQAIKKQSSAADMVYLASDEDREGEAISWHLKESLNLKEDKYKRIVFTEITKKTILSAIQNPRSIDIDLVNAQQARRVLDRLVGFELSPILWKKIQSGLSAGRVQSVAVRLVVEREREIEKFIPTSAYKISAHFNLEKGKILVAELTDKLKHESEVAEFLNSCIGATFKIKDLSKKMAKKSPAAPFTTSTLQQEAGRKLGFSVLKTMVIAQRLYEAGKISYMRTDSVNLSEEAVQGAKHQIESSFGENYVQIRKYKTKSSGAQEAHEAIRPTDFSTLVAGEDQNGKRLYELIWKRAIASQMADAELEKTTATISISTSPRILVANGEVIKFDGFLRVYLESKDEEDHESEQEVGKILPPLKVGQVLEMSEILGHQTFTRHLPRYTEPTLVKKLEELGIGRPSTYAPTISTIQKRGYVVKESREGVEREYKVYRLVKDKISQSMKKEIVGIEKNKLFPTNIAMIVNDFLVIHFPDITNYSFTANIEQEFDAIASGKVKWQEMMKKFYWPFHKVVEETEKVERTSVSNRSRQIGIDPKTGKMIYAKLGRFGAYIQIGENPQEGSSEKPKFAGLKPGQFIENITLEDALELTKMPRSLGEFEDKPIAVNIGRFGPYILHDKKFVSLPKGEDPYSITPERAEELIIEKRQSDANKILKTFAENPDIRVLNGRYGPYIEAGKKNVRISKDQDPLELTLEECLSLAEKAPEKKRKFFKKKT